MNVIGLELTTEELLVAYYLLQLPGEIRSRIELSLRDKKKSKFKFSDITPAIDEVCRTEEFGKYDAPILESLDTDINSCTVAAGQPYKAKPYASANSNMSGSGTIPKYQDQNYSVDGRGRGYGSRGYGARGRGRGGGRKNDAYCLICQREGHKANQCKAYTAGPEMRKRLQDLDICDACLTPKHQHPNECRIDNYCHKCGSRSHRPNTCGGESDKHPGSWIHNGGKK